MHGIKNSLYYGFKFHFYYDIQLDLTKYIISIHLYKLLNLIIKKIIKIAKYKFI